MALWYDHIDGLAQHALWILIKLHECSWVVDTVHFHLVALQKTPCLLNFSYACPEPVLVK